MFFFFIYTLGSVKHLNVIIQVCFRALFVLSPTFLDFWGFYSLLVKMWGKKEEEEEKKERKLPSLKDDTAPELEL